MTTREEWRPVPGYEGFYEVSSRGRVRSLDRVVVNANGHSVRREGKILSPGFTYNGYPRVSLNRGGARKVRTIHRLMAAAFIGPRPDGMEVRHINGIPTDNVVENLSYGTSSENTRDCIKHGRHNNASRTHCRRGHEFSPENTRVDGDGRRVCRACESARGRRKRSRVVSEGVTDA